MKNPLAVVAVGGNALIKDQQHNSIPDQYKAVKESARYLADMVEAGYSLVVTHGNGPQVGFIMRRSELAKEEVAPVPLDYAVGDTQGAIGYMFQKALCNEFSARKIHKPVVALVTQTLVSKNDRAFSHPTKPVGAFMDRETALYRQKNNGWSVVEETGRGWRRTVPSPSPLAVIEYQMIAKLQAEGCVVIACGGGGIPVIYNEDNQLEGVEAVIDKDLAASLLADQLNADLFLIPTEVHKIAVNFGTPQQKWLDKLSVTEAEEMLRQKQFGAGSMQPKVEAVINFLKKGLEKGQKRRGLITGLQVMKEALHRENGTEIYS